MLPHKVAQLSTEFGFLIEEVSALRSAAAGIQTLSEEISALKMQIVEKQRKKFGCGTPLTGLE
jgi:hypothetical protein